MSSQSRLSTFLSRSEYVNLVSDHRVTEQDSYIPQALMLRGNELWISKFLSGLRNGGREKYKTPPTPRQGVKEELSFHSNLRKQVGPWCL